MPFASTTMLPSGEEPVLSSTAALAFDDCAGPDDGAVDAAPEDDAPVVAGAVADGVVPALLPQPVRAAARARMASPAPRCCFMVCSLAVCFLGCHLAGAPRWNTGTLTPTTPSGKEWFT